MAELDAEQALALLDSYNRQIDALARQLNFIQAILDETRRARASLAGLKEAHDSELLVPVGANTFVHAQVTNRDSVLSGIGSNLSVEKPVAEAEAGLAKREEELQGQMQSLGERIVRMQQEAAALQEQLEDAFPAGAGAGAR